MSILLAISWPTVLNISVWGVGIALVLVFGYRFLLRQMRDPEQTNKDDRFVSLDSLDRQYCAEKVVFHFTLPIASEVVFEVLNERFELLEELINESRLPGQYHLPYTIQHLPNGVYRYRLTTDNRQMEKTFKVNHQKGKAMEVAYEKL